MMEQDTLKKMPLIGCLPMHLQWFAEDASGEKTEQPTAKKKEKAREEGQVAKSVEITSALLILSMFASFKYFGGFLIDRMVLLMQDMYGLFGTQDFNLAYASGIVNHVLMVMILGMLPFLSIAFMVALLTNLLQVGWHPSSKPLQPKLNRFNPIEGFKNRIFSLKSVIELIKSILKIAFILVIVYNSIRGYDQLILIFYDLPIFEAYGLIVTICLDIGIQVGAFFIIIAAIDFAYQKYDLNKKLKMTKHEVKEEFKQTEGNPEIKSKIRQKMREAAMRRMMQDLPNADVIITNPTHFAVAISYNVLSAKAPVVLAKGADLVAARIREAAKTHSIEMVENKALARTLYYTVEIGEEIPEALYQTVAEVLAFVYNLKETKNEGVIL